MTILFLLLAQIAFAKWPGEGGKICLDTPKPLRASGQEYREAQSEGMPGMDKSKQDERLQKLLNRPLRFAGKLFVQVEGGKLIPLPSEKGVYLSGFDPKKSPLVKIKNAKGKIETQLKVEFPKDGRVKIAQGSFYHIDMQIDPAPQECPWQN